MSLAVHLSGLTALNLLAPIDATATVNATGAWVALPACEGEVLISAHAGILDAGSVTWTLETADDGSGTGATAVTFTEGAFTQVTTSNDDPNIQFRTFPATQNKGYLKITGTIVTGGALVGASAFYKKKYN
jgi:hypothetical protein